MDISDFLESVKAWADREPQIRAVVLVGSYARGSAREDSDVDLVLIASDPTIYIQNHFVDTFGTAMKIQKEDWGLVTSIRTWYENGLEVEFGITSPVWIKKPLDSGTARVLSDGYRVLLDKDQHFRDVCISAISE